MSSQKKNDIKRAIILALVLLPGIAWLCWNLQIPMYMVAVAFMIFAPVGYGYIILDRRIKSDNRRR